VDSQAQARQRDSSVAVEPNGQKFVLCAEDRHASGIRLFAEGRFPEALTALEEALEATGRAPAEWWNDWGAAAYACGEMKKAEEGFRRALELNPEDSRPAGNLGMLLAQLGRAMEAIPFLDRSVGGLIEPHRSAIAATLDACRIRAATDALAASQAAYQAFFAQAPEPPPTEKPESEELQATEY
jgi:Flp pilus assembly protein TadD